MWNLELIDIINLKLMVTIGRIKPFSSDSENKMQKLNLNYG